MVRLGIAGLGYIGRIHFQAARQIPQVRVVAIASSRSEESAKFCGPGVKVYARYEDLLQDGELDAVVVCVPTFLHEPYAAEAGARGLHVLCEKPFALDAASSGRMLEAARRAGIILMIAQVLRFWPEYARILQLTSEGAIGSLRAVSAYRLARYPAWGEWFRDPQKSGGSLLDVQVHDVDFVYALAGMPRKVYAAGIRSAAGSWDHAITTLHYAGAVASAESTFLMPESWPFSCGIRVVGSAGCLEYGFRVAGNIEQRDEAAAKLVLYHSDGTMSEPEVEAEDMYAAQLRYFADCVEKAQPPAICPPEESHEVMKIMDACRRSAESGLPVDLLSGAPEGVPAGKIAGAGQGGGFHERHG